jgi:mevalonate kinase
VIGDTRQEKDTPRILAWLGQRFREKEEAFMEGMRNIVEIVERAREELKRAHPRRDRIGQLMNENQHYLSKYLKVSGSCPVSPSHLDRLIQAALGSGALGAKLSGSGGGGAMVALSEPEDVEAVARAIRRAGGDAYITKVAQQGLAIEHIE